MRFSLPPKQTQIKPAKPYQMRYTDPSEAGMQRGFYPDNNLTCDLMSRLIWFLFQNLSLFHISRTGHYPHQPDNE